MIAWIYKEYLLIRFQINQVFLEDLLNLLLWIKFTILQPLFQKKIEIKQDFNFLSRTRSQIITSLTYQMNKKDSNVFWKPELVDFHTPFWMVLWGQLLLAGIMLIIVMNGLAPNIFSMVARC